MSIDSYIQQFGKLKVNKRGEHESPHKPCMVLAVIGMAEAGLLKENKIYFMPPLLDRYLEIFNIVKTETDHPNPYFPFFHLRSERFWHLSPKKERSAVLEAMSTARSYADITDNIEYAYLDPELYDGLKNAITRSDLRAYLITRWLGSYGKKLQGILDQDQYEKNLRDSVETGIKELPVKEYEKAARDTAFRRIVTEAYDYRCAASGKRIVLPGDIVMVEAAHLIPFSETHDDDPRNGIALTPDYHWALDRNIIAPGPDYRWHISKMVDERIADNRPLVELDGKELILPRDKRFWPREDALKSRLQSLK